MVVWRTWRGIKGFKLWWEPFGVSCANLLDLFVRLMLLHMLYGPMMVVVFGVCLVVIFNLLRSDLNTTSATWWSMTMAAAQHYRRAASPLDRLRFKMEASPD